MRTTPLFLSSGDLIADRRYQHARDFEARDDLQAAADLLAQAVERAPDFASAWFALGEVRERLGDRAAAVEAFARAHAADPADRHGAAVRLARLGAGEAHSAMAPGYVRTLFDQYAPRFDHALADLSYRAPALLFDAIEKVCRTSGRDLRWGSMLDLGCGTGLAGAAFRPYVDWLVGVDLSPGMVEQARRKGLYDRLSVGDVTQFLAEQIGGNASFHIVIAADVFAYVADLAGICGAVARVLASGGILAFTVETHPGGGAILGETLRYAHGADHVRTAVAGAGLTLRHCAAASTRTENGAPVPGLRVVAERLPYSDARAAR
jgi:predicted TPR repeat methyltransferase